MESFAAAAIFSLIARLFLMISLMLMGTAPVWCDGFVQKSTEAMGGVYHQIYVVGTKLFPIVIVALIVALFVSHDERAIKTEIKSLVIVIILYAALMILGENIDTAQTVVDDTLQSELNVTP